MFSLDGSDRRGGGQLPPPHGELQPASLLCGAGEGLERPQQEGSQGLQASLREEALTQGQGKVTLA